MISTPTYSNNAKTIFESVATMCNYKNHEQSMDKLDNVTGFLLLQWGPGHNPGASNYWCVNVSFPRNGNMTVFADRLANMRFVIACPVFCCAKGPSYYPGATNECFNTNMRVPCTALPCHRMHGLQ